jgi:hypothetical protein
MFAACNQQPVKTAAPVVSGPAKTTLPAPFRYHKLIESSPGKYFDVFGWGRGKDSSGAYMILHSDSAGKQYSNTSGDLEGSIIDVYNTDMNMDGNPEILIEAKAKDTTNHVNIYAYEFKGGKGNKLTFPKLTDKTKKQYRGDDYFYIKDGFLIREFPVYDGTGVNAKPTGQKKILQYGLRDAEFTVKDISPVDSSAIQKETALKDSVKKAKATKADKPVDNKPKKKHKEEDKPKKKKKKHRHSKD